MNAVSSNLSAAAEAALDHLTPTGAKPIHEAVPPSARSPRINALDAEAEVFTVARGYNGKRPLYATVARPRRLYQATHFGRESGFYPVSATDVADILLGKGRAETLRIKDRVLAEASAISAAPAWMKAGALVIAYGKIVGELTGKFCRNHEGKPSAFYRPLGSRPAPTWASFDELTPARPGAVPAALAAHTGRIKYPDEPKHFEVVWREDAAVCRPTYGAELIPATEAEVVS